MSSSFFHFQVYFIALCIFLVCTCCFFIPFLQNVDIFQSNIPEQNSVILSSIRFLWPIPGYTRISSRFGPRSSPTAGASSYHKGIDIPAPPGTSLVAICDGTVLSSGFAGSGGFTVTYLAPPYRISYCHVSPNLLVSSGQKISAGQIIAMVGPKNISGIIGNPYKDANGNPTNGSLTGPHLHFSIKKDDVSIDPLSLF